MMRHGQGTSCVELLLRRDIVDIEEVNEDGRTALCAVCFVPAGRGTNILRLNTKFLSIMLPHIMLLFHTTTTYTTDYSCALCKSTDRRSIFNLSP